MAKEKILIVDDEQSMCDFFGIMLKREGYRVTAASSGEQAIEYLRKSSCSLVITDIKMPGIGGIGLLKKVKELAPETIVIMITAYASIDTAIEAMKLGAYDYFTKPFKVDEVKHHIRKALDVRRLEKENILLKRELESRYGFSNLIGTSSRMVEIYDLIKRVADKNVNIFITGESGTGKELVARAIHYEGGKRERSFVAINCGAIPDNLLESELFGHQKGSFTGAVANKEGLFEVADGGTILLDEITEMPLHLQVKLLRCTQESRFRRVGGVEDISVDVRLISASNTDVEVEVKEGRFREDLYYRLNVISIHLPPLRERREDIPLLANHFIEKCRVKLGRDVRAVSSEAMEHLKRYHYPGNVRELENIIERAVALESSAVILPESLPPHVVHGVEGNLPSRALPDQFPHDGLDLGKSVEEYEKRMLVNALREAGGVKKRAADLLGLTFRSMRYKLDKYGLE
ncbi:MAG: sigma-54-dependent Fis family transcriptional regulator [Deltaproteobacteria bacterium]|nr:sigma-54-dependent Fis family transcriptional regulator [Deltaproteobacteria bacterium]